MRRNPSSGCIERSSPPVDSTASRNGYMQCINAVTHGFRSSFRDYAAERTHTPHAVMEPAPAKSAASLGRDRDHTGGPARSGAPLTTPKRG